MSPRSSACPSSFAVVAAFLVAATAAAQEREPAFPTQAEAITVDVVVLDRDGHPVRGLNKGDFTVLQDGKPQDVVAFETRDLTASRPSEAVAAAAVGLPRAEGEEPAGPSGRTLAFIVDDLSLDGRSKGAIDAMRRWLIEQADPRDNLTLVTTSGEVQWSGLVGSGRGEAIHALAKVRYLRPSTTFFTPADPKDPYPPPFTEWAAYQIATGRITSGGREPTPEQRRTAEQIYDWWSRRAQAVAAAIEGFSKGHEPERGRKAAFVFSQGFIRDEDRKQVDQAARSSLQGNVAVYFVGARGLATPDDSVGSHGRPATVDLIEFFGDVGREADRHVDTAGGEELAAETGGAAIRDTNDLFGRLTGAVDESSAYYLLGYQPAGPPDGKWHKLEVKVGAQGVTVRARRGYFATRTTVAGSTASAKGSPEAPPDRPAPAVQEANGEDDASRKAASPSVTSQATSQAASPGNVPAFPTRAEAITVDVVVLDKDGRPVKDLAKGDFTLFEDGRPQPIVGFETRTLAPSTGEAQPTVAEDTAGATNERKAGATGRTLAFLVDDLGIEPLHMIDVRKSLSQWLAEGADPRDELTIVTTSGDAWWSDTVGDGRADLEAVLARIKGKKDPVASRDAMSDWEGYSIDTLESPIDSLPPAPTGPPIGATACAQPSGVNLSVGDRVVDRWFRSGACICDPMNIPSSIRSCRGLVQGRARQVYSAARQRAVGLLAGVERISRGLGGARGRKSVIVLSEGLLRDTDQIALNRAVDASRRGNTAVSFVDVRGLVGSSSYAAEQSAPPKPGDLGTMTVEQTILETAGGEYIAETTGGLLVHNTNDITGGVARLADELSAYYLLGYQSDRPVDGKWHKLEVKVARPGVTVRARRGYFARAADPPLQVASKGKGEDKGKKQGKERALPVRALDPALAVGGERDEIPIRIAPYVMETDASGTARVLVAVEVGTTALTFSGTGGERKAQLDVTALGVSRDQPKTVSLDAHVELGVDAKAVGGWWTFTRELRLPPGPAQIRALVRDTVSGRSGLVAHRVVVPPSDAAYLSTLILSDYMAPPEGRFGSPRLVPVAHRRFRPQTPLYCAYEVYPAPGGRALQEIPRIAGGYTVEDAEGRVVASASPTPIAIALDGQITRLLTIPLDRLAPGPYRLRIQTSDRATGATLEATEAFSVEAPVSADSKPD